MAEQQGDESVRLNYVIPGRLGHLLQQYCAQTEMKPGPLVRRLVSDFVKGDIGINLDEMTHPKGRRTSVDLPGRLLEALEVKCEEIGAPTKAAVIAALLGDFLPPRVDTEGIEKVTVAIPTSIYSKIYDRYGPGPIEDVVIEALCDLIQKNNSRAVPCEQEA
jgi:hypothetical protein